MQDAVSAFHIFGDSRKAVAMVDCNGAVLSCNTLMTHLVGKSVEDIFGKRCTELLNCENSATHHCILDKISHTRQKEHTFCRFKDQWVETILEPLIGKDDELQGAVLSFSCVEPPAEAMQKLLRTQRFESIATITTGVAHDFNNVLTILDAHTSLLEVALAKDSETLNSLSAMQIAITRAKELTKQLTNINKPPTISNKPVPIQEHIIDAVNFSLIGSKTRLILNIPENLASIHADTDQIKQLVCNLTINARQAISNGHGVIEIEADSISVRKAENLKLKPGEYIRLQIKDNGSGIAKEDIDSIFEPYFTTKPDGTGLGLSTVNYIIKQHKGYLNVRSEPGTGTTFTVYLNAEN